MLADWRRRTLRELETSLDWLAGFFKPAGVLVGFASEDDWFDYKLENDPRFLQRVAQARKSLEAGKGVKLEELQIDSTPRRRRTKRGT